MKVKVKSLSRVRLLVTPWTVAYQAPLTMRFSRQGYWTGLSFPSPGDLPNPGTELRSPTLQADSLPTEPQVAKNPPPANTGLDRWVGKIPWRSTRQSIPVFLLGESHG